MFSAQRKSLEAQIYNEKINQDKPRFSTFFYKPIYNFLVSLDYHPYQDNLGNQFLKNKSVLAIGASRNDLKFLTKFTTHITANNISQKELETLAEYYPNTNTVLSDAEDLSNFKQKFDIVFCRSILHHLHPLENVLSQIHQLLKPNGLLFIYSEPGYYHPFAFLGRRLTPSSSHTPGEQAFKFHQFEHQLKQNFSPIKIRYFFFLSIMLPIIAQKIPIFRKSCHFLVKPLVLFDRFLSRIPICKNLFWITSAVYEKA